MEFSATKIISTEWWTGAKTNDDELGEKRRAVNDWKFLFLIAVKILSNAFSFKT